MSNKIEDDILVKFDDHFDNYLEVLNAMPDWQEAKYQAKREAKKLLKEMENDSKDIKKDKLSFIKSFLEKALYINKFELDEVCEDFKYFEFKKNNWMKEIR